MAAPDGIKWGEVAGGYGRIGIYATRSNTNTQSTIKVEIWFWSKYTITDENNELYFDNLSSSGSASTKRGATDIVTTVNTGSGWSTTNQKKLRSYTYTHDRTKSSSTRYLYAKLTNIDRVGATMYVSTTISVPAKPSYTVSFNLNGASGSVSSRTKWYDEALSLPTASRTGYEFLGWDTSSSATTPDYAVGKNYTTNAGDTLYAVWKADTYRITYNANGGTGAPGYQTKTYDKTLKLSTTKPTRTNYAFLGWSTSKTAKAATYSAGGNYTANSAATLYAVWELSYVKPTVENLIVRRVRNGYVYTKTETVIDPLKGTLMEGTRTKTGEQVYMYETDDAIVYYCIVAEEVASDTGDKEKQLVYYEVSNGGVNTWTAADDGNAIQVAFGWETFLTATSVKIAVVASNGGVIDEYAPDVSAKTGTVSEYLAKDLLDPDSSYVVTIAVSDKQTDGSGGEFVITKNIAGNKFVIDFRKGGTGVAVGKAAELDGWFDVAYDTSLHKNLQFDYNGRIYGHKPEGERVEVLDTMSTYGNIALGWGNYNLKSGTLNLYGHDVHIGVSNIPTRALHRTYLRRGDSILVKLYTAGYVTNGGADVRFVIPLSMPVFGNPTATFTSVTELVLRQNNKYTHGSAWNSSSSTYTSATISTMSIDDGRKDNYEFDHTDIGSRPIYSSLPVTIKLASTVDAINNETIGIRFTGTVTFT